MTSNTASGIAHFLSNSVTSTSPQQKTSTPPWFFCKKVWHHHRECYLAKFLSDHRSTSPTHRAYLRLLLARITVVKCKLHSTYMFKFLEAWVGFKDFSRPVFLIQGVAVDEGPPRFELQLEELGDVPLVWFWPLPQFLKSPIMPGLGFTAVFLYVGPLWFSLLH